MKQLPGKSKVVRNSSRDYYAERQLKWVWIFPKIDRRMSLDRIVDFDIFLQVLFSHSMKKRDVAKAIVEILIREKRPMFLRELQYKVWDKVKVSAQTLSDTYKAMVRSGLLEKKYRNYPTKLSSQFSNRLRDLAQYWENYLKAKYEG